MTRLVLHAGAEFTDGGAVQRDLVGWREELPGLKVMTPAAAGPEQWRDAAQGLLHKRASPSAARLLSAATEGQAEIVLVSSDALSDALTSPDEVTALVDAATTAGLDVRVVVVVREQIGYINDLYCHRVLSLDTARSFAEFAATSVPAHRFDYVASFGAIADAEAVELVAVDYPELQAKGAGRVVLEAAGLSADAVAGLPLLDQGPAPVPGPVLVGATRLMHKRMRRLGMFNDHGKPRLRRLVDGLTAHATEAGWDEEPFWGWDPAPRRRAEAEHGPSNQLFAEFVWGTSWPEPWSDGKANRVDLADLKPRVLRDVLTTVDGLLDSLSQSPVDTDQTYDDEPDVLGDPDEEA